MAGLPNLAEVTLLEPEQEIRTGLDLACLHRFGISVSQVANTL